MFRAEGAGDGLPVAPYAPEKVDEGPKEGCAAACAACVGAANADADADADAEEEGCGSDHSIVSTSRTDRSERPCFPFHPPKT